MVQTETINSSTGTGSTTTSYCANRLPCGYCMVLGRACPMQNTITWTTPSWTWNTPTCNCGGNNA